MLFNSPYWLRLLGGSGLTWEMRSKAKELYLTFDDGPNPDTSPFILELLQKYDVKATFFCVGDNVEKHPQHYQNILDAGHAVGNHGYNHLMGWKTPTKDYLEDVEKCRQVVDSTLFRPPYGKMSKGQQKVLKKDYKIIMWTVLSRDFDAGVDRETCLRKSLHYTHPGAIVLFHDSSKAFEKVQWVLPRYLKATLESGYTFKLLG